MTTVRQKKPTAKKSTARPAKAKQNWYRVLLARRFAKPTLVVLAFAIIGAGTIWWASAATTTYSLWDNGAVPKLITADDPKSVELGVRFHAKVAGYVTGIRFYKGAQNTGTHTGSLWSVKGRKHQLLAQVTFKDETKTGWQTATFSSPVPVAANTDYIASYFAPKGHYSANNFYFQRHSQTHNDLVAPSDGIGKPNGVYLYSRRGGFPSETYQATNYWVDVTFNTKLISPQPAPAAPTNVTGTLNSKNTSVTVAWQASTSANPISNYIVYRNGSKLATVTNGTTYTDATIQSGTTYRYQVQAADNTGETSALSTAVSVAVPTADNPVPPAPTPPTPTPPTTPSAPSGSWPTADDTGASGTLTNVNGDVILDKANQVYQNMRVNGTINVLACGVTLKNVEVDTGEPYKGDSTPDLFAIWLKAPENCSTTLDHVSVIAGGSSSTIYATEAVRNAYGESQTITNSKFVGTQLGIGGLGPGLIQGNYSLLGATMRGDHNENVETDGTNNLTFDHNTFLNPNGQTAALAIFTEFGSNKNLTFTNNLLAGGGYTVYAGDGKSDNDGNPARAQNVSFINNVFWKKYFPNVGNFGPGRAYNPAGGGQWTNNVYMNADGTLTTTQVPQPAIDQ